MEMATTRVKREEDCVVCELVVALEADGSLCYYRQAQRKEKKNRRRIRYPATGTIKEDKRMEMATTRGGSAMLRHPKKGEGKEGAFEHQYETPGGA